MPHTVHLEWDAPLRARDGEPTYGYVVYRFMEGEKINLDDPSKIIKISFNNATSYSDNSGVKGATYQYVVTAIDRLKNESLPSNVTTAYIL